MNHTLFSRRRRLLAGLALTPLSAAWAQFRVDVSGVGMTQLPIAVAGFRGEDRSPEKLAAIVAADLERSGQFRAVAPGTAVLEPGGFTKLSNRRFRTATFCVSLTYSHPFARCSWTGLALPCCCCLGSYF